MSSHRTVMALILASTALAGTSAFAQAASPDKAAGRAPQANPPADTALGEVIVTAQKRAERLIDVPVSIATESGDQLTRQGVFTTADLQKIAPGFTYQQGAYGSPILTIRGIGLNDEQVAAAPTVTVYTDQIPLPYSRMTEGAGIDVERVEILKGPQGTLFGENSTGGAINYIAAKPTDDFTAGFDGTYGRFNEANAAAFVSGSLADGLTARLAVRSETRSDWQESTTRDEGTGRRDFQAARLLIDWRPSDQLLLELNVNGWRDRSDLPVIQPRGYLPLNDLLPSTAVTIATANALRTYPYSTGDNPRAVDFDPNFSLRRDDHLYQVSLRGEYGVTDTIRLISLSSYAHFKSFSPIDGDGTNVLDFRDLQFGKINTFSQEVRLEQNTSKLKWVIGLNYKHDRTGDFQEVTLDGSNAELFGIHFDRLNLNNDMRVRDLAGFGNLEYQISDTLSLQGALRYTQSKTSSSSCMSDSGTPLGFRIALGFLGIQSGQCITLLPNGQPGAYSANLNQNNLSWRGGVNWKPSTDTLVYMNLTKGYKAGTFGTLPAVSYLQLQPVTEEAVLAYEGGVKKRISGIADLSGAVFYDDYRNKQIAGYVLVPPFGNLVSLVNIPKSRVYGAELNLLLRPIDGLRISTGGTYINSKVTQTAIVGSPFNTIIDAKGEAFPLTAKWQLTNDAQYDYTLRNGMTAYVGASLTYQSSTVAAFGAKTGPAALSDAFVVRPYALLDLRVGIGVAPKYRVQLWVKNVTDKGYWTNVLHTYDVYGRLYGMPRTFGITTSLRM